MENELSNQERLDYISDMIRQAKSNYHHRGSFYFLLWGWVVMLAHLSHYVLASNGFPNPELVWILTFPAAIISAVKGSRESKGQVRSTHYDHIYMHVWIAVGFMVVVTLIFMPQLGFNHNPIILLAAGVGTYVSGNLLNFKPLVLGGIVLGLGAIGCFFVSVTDQYLIGAIAIALGYLVPGYLLKRKENERS